MKVSRRPSEIFFFFCFVRDNRKGSKKISLKLTMLISDTKQKRAATTETVEHMASLAVGTLAVFLFASVLNKQENDFP